MENVLIQEINSLMEEIQAADCHKELFVRLRALRMIARKDPHWARIRANEFANSWGKRPNLPASSYEVASNAGSRQKVRLCARLAAAASRMWIAECN